MKVMLVELPNSIRCWPNADRVISAPRSINFCPPGVFIPQMFHLRKVHWWFLGCSPLPVTLLPRGIKPSLEPLLRGRYYQGIRWAEYTWTWQSCPKKRIGKRGLDGLDCISEGENILAYTNPEKLKGFKYFARRLTWLRFHPSFSLPKRRTKKPPR